jgi:hypothetical protein
VVVTPGAADAAYERRGHRPALPTTLAIGLLGLGFHTGVIALRATVTASLDRADVRLKHWQQRRWAQPGCESQSNGARLARYRRRSGLEKLQSARPPLSMIPASRSDSSARRTPPRGSPG